MDGDGAKQSPPTPAREAMDRAFFSFPYEPYDIQLQLMCQLWDTIDRRHVGIFESPTGTGKSISLICGALTWLTKNTDEYGLLKSSDAAVEAEAVEEKSAEPSWLSAFDQQKAAKETKHQQAQLKGELVEIEKIREEPTQLTKKRKLAFAYNHHERKKVPRGIATSSKPTDAKDGDKDGEEYLVEAYDSERSRRPGSGSDSESELTPSLGIRRDARSLDNPHPNVVKIIYCSRTHSQISQFIREINKTAFGAHVRVISLGSRKILCVNPAVTSLKSDLRMTDKCLDMLQGAKSKKSANGKKQKTAKCPFYEKELLTHYKDYALAHVQDIEDLHTLGEEMSICSYYGARESIPLAQVVAMPYSMLLSKDTRESMGIQLEDNIVVFDEAHNIVEAINNTYKVEISSKQLVVARRSLWSYFKKYEKRFKGKNAFYIKQLLSILESLTKFLRQLSKTAAKGSSTTGGDGQTDAGTGAQAKMLMINDFLFEARIDHFNIFKILVYLKESELGKKVMGFVDSESTQGTASLPEETATATTDETFESRHISPLRIVESLLKALTSAGGDGRIMVQPQNPSTNTEASIKFLLLNSAVHFQEIVEKARSVVLAGGTMQPVSQVITQLFSYLPEDQIDFFSCGHVIPPENLIGFSLSVGPTQRHLEFTYARRNDLEAVDELGRVVLNLSRVVPGGIVVFFPSYRFEDSTVRRWQASKLFAQIEEKKTIFREPKQSDELARVLADYSAASSRGGALLLSVVGGKMSEGINFSDELARCVVMVGMPYPNARDVELVEKMAFLDKRTPGAGRQYYESLCMKAVNQSIGRAIRHQRDYASIVLVDHRYSNPNVRRRLPEWIQRRMQPPSATFGQVYSNLVRFYKAKEAQPK